MKSTAPIRAGDDWRSTMLECIRVLIKQADPDVVEQRKWRGVPVWSHDGIVCTGETALNALIREAVALNTSGAKKSKKR